MNSGSIKTKVNLHGSIICLGARGYSNYEIAVQNGFEGSEQEWLDSLVGPVGPQGPMGPSNIYVGDEEPTDKNINVWFDTNEEADIPTGGVVEEIDPTVPSHVKAITQEDIDKWNSNTSSGSGLTTEQINALNEMFKVCAYVKEDVNTEYEAFKTAFGIDGESGEIEPTKTLQSISATYTGGNVKVGTNVNTLTGITVKVNYSDGSQENVTNYTLSGNITEGNNTITVSYEGLTTTFIVVGIAESTGGEETNVSNETTWTDGVAYTYTAVDGSYVEPSGKLADYASWSRTPYLYCKGASKLRVKAITPSSQYSGGNGGYNCFYDEDKNFIQSFSFEGLSSTEAGSTVDINIPANATYLICSGKGPVISASNSANNTGKPYLEFIPYA